MPDTQAFHIGTAGGGGQYNFGGHHNTFHQFNQAADARVAELLTELRGRLGDFTDPSAAGQAIEVVAAEPRSARGLQAMSKLLAYVKPGTEAVTAMTALTTAIHEAMG